MPKQVTITPEVRDLLERSTVTGSADRPVVQLPPGQLDRAQYVAVDKVLKALGGKWNRAANGHQFDRPVEGELAEALRAGVAVDAKRTAEQFFTPAQVADRLVQLAGIESGHTVLEPSAGAGAIIAAISRGTNPTVIIDAVERDQRLADALRAEWGRRATIVCADFLTCVPDPTRQFDRVLMNPPFSRGQDMAHVRHAYRFLRPGGRLVAIMGTHWSFATDRATATFQAWLQHDDDTIDSYQWEALPPATFRESGTDVNTGILTISRKG